MTHTMWTKVTWSRPVISCSEIRQRKERQKSPEQVPLGVRHRVVVLKEAELHMGAGQVCQQLYAPRLIRHWPDQNPVPQNLQDGGDRSDPPPWPLCDLPGNHEISKQVKMRINDWEIEIYDNRFLGLIINTNVERKMLKRCKTAENERSPELKVALYVLLFPLQNSTIVTKDNHFMNCNILIHIIKC